MIKVGQPIPISLQLFDGATDKFVRAVVRNSSGSAISGSPFALTHVAGGQYSNLSVLMPDTKFVTVQYKVYTDSGFTTASATHADALETFERDSDTDCAPLVGIVESISPPIGVVEEC